MVISLIRRAVQTEKLGDDLLAEIQANLTVELLTNPQIHDEPHLFHAVRDTMQQHGIKTKKKQ